MPVTTVPVPATESTRSIGMRKRSPASRRVQRRREPAEPRSQLGRCPAPVRADTTIGSPKATLDGASHSATSALHERQPFRLHRVGLGDDGEARRDLELLEHDQVLAALRHDAVVGGDDQERHVDARGTGNHGAHEVLVPRHVDDARQ